MIERMQGSEQHESRNVKNTKRASGGLRASNTCVRYHCTKTFCTNLFQLRNRSNRPPTEELRGMLSDAQSHPKRVSASVLLRGAMCPRLVSPAVESVYIVAL